MKSFNLRILREILFFAASVQTRSRGHLRASLAASSLRVSEQSRRSPIRDYPDSLPVEKLRHLRSSSRHAGKRVHAGGSENKAQCALMLVQRP